MTAETAMQIHLIIHAAGIATVLLIVAYFILFTAQRSVGFVSALGTLLAIWLIVMAGVVVAGAVSAPMFGGKPFGLDIPGPHGSWMHHDGQEAPPAVEPAPVQPDAAPTQPEAAPVPSGG